MQNGLYAMITIVSKHGHVYGRREWKDESICVFSWWVFFAIFKIILSSCCLFVTSKSLCA